MMQLKLLFHSVRYGQIARNINKNVEALSKAGNLYGAFG